MSSLFYDKLIIFEKIEIVIKNAALTPDEREELWNLVDQIVHPRILTTILDNLPREHHSEFLEKFHSSPHDENLISYLNEKVGSDVEKLIRLEIDKLEKEIVKEIKQK